MFIRLYITIVKISSFSVLLLLPFSLGQQNQLLLQTKCPLKCYNGQNCKDPDCAPCMFNCLGDVCNVVTKAGDECVLYCRPQDCNTKIECKGCRFCFYESAQKKYIEQLNSHNTVYNVSSSSSSSSTLTQSNTFKNSNMIKCNDWCTKSKHCVYTKQCGNCEYCKNINNHNLCAYWCTQAGCEYDKCKGCDFCSKANDPLVTLPFYFTDYTSKVFSSYSSYWYRWLHSGEPYHHQGTPLFVDLNEDGVLDYFNSMHAHWAPFCTFLDRMELAQVSLTGNDNDITPSLEPISERIILNDSQVLQLDTHGSNIIDLDGDGVLDILISNGGGQETIDLMVDPDRLNLLLWGENRLDPISGELVTFFVGGREAAIEAGVQMPGGRGRLNYVFDADGDGLLDVFCFQDRRSTNDITPGILLMNQGRSRKFEEDFGMREYTAAMILTDIDGDGFAQEILLSRGPCLPYRDGPETDPEFPEFGEYSSDVIEFCRSRPVGSLAVYKFNQNTKKMEEISNHYTNISANKSLQSPCCQNGIYVGENDCHALSMAAGDLDGDLIVDHIILYVSKMLLYFSVDRKPNDLIEGKSDIGTEIIFPKYCSAAQAVRLVDLDNDGVEEIVVACRNSNTFLLYSRGKSFREWSLIEEINGVVPYGDMADFSRVTYNDSELIEFCNKDPPDTWNRLKTDICNHSSNNERIKIEFAGLCFVDIDNDGYLEAVVSYNFGYLRFFKNTAPKLNRYIKFQLKGDGSTVNQYGIGASLTLTTKAGDQVLYQVREVNSYQHTSDKYGCKEDRIIFGLGLKSQPVRLQIKWPNGHEQISYLKWWDFEKHGKYVVKIVFDAVPSVAPSFTPTHRPTLKPTKSPSTSPSASPSASPSSSFCYDNPSFKYDGNSCEKIGAKEALRQKACLQAQVRDACPLSCGVCCKDDSTFSFWVAKQPEPCSFLSTLNNQQMKRKCSVKKISFRCPQTCGKCKSSIL